MRGLREQQPAQQRAAAEAGRDVSHLRKAAAAHVDEILDHPAAGRQHRAQVEEEEGAQKPHARCGGSRADEPPRLAASRRPRAPVRPEPQRVVKGNQHQGQVGDAHGQREHVEQVPPRHGGHSCSDKGPGETPGHVGGVDGGEPAVRAGHARRQRVPVRVLEGLADAHEPEGGDEQAERGVPRAEAMRGDLARRAEGEHGPEV